MKSKRPILHLIVSINNKRYVLGTLRFNKNEFSYFFTYPGDSPGQHFNCDTREFTSPLDHITWHKDRVHIKRRDGVVVEPVYYDGGPLLSEPPRITPLYVESIYFEEDPCSIREKDFPSWKGSRSQKLLSLKSSKGFSLIFILAPSGIPTSDILSGFQFQKTPPGLSKPPCLADLCDVDHRSGKILVWEKWNLVAVTSRYIRNITSIPSEIGKNFRMPDYKNIPAALTDLMLQSLMAKSAD